MFDVQAPRSQGTCVSYIRILNSCSANLVPKSLSRGRSTGWSEESRDCGALITMPKRLGQLSVVITTSSSTRIRYNMVCHRASHFSLPYQFQIKSLNYNTLNQLEYFESECSLTTISCLIRQPVYSPAMS